MHHLQIVRWGWLMIAAAVVVAVYLFGVDIPRKSRLFGPEGREAEGIVLTKREDQRGRVPVYVAQVEFPDATGSNRVADCRYSVERWVSLTEGAKVRVRYLPAEPTHAVDLQSDWGQPPNSQWAALVCGVMAAVGGAAVLIGRRMRGGKQPARRKGA